MAPKQIFTDCVLKHFLHLKKAKLTWGVCRGSADEYQRQRVNNTVDWPMMQFGCLQTEEKQKDEL